MAFESVKKILKQNTGLSLNSEDPDVTDDIISQYMENSGFNSENKLLEFLQSNTKELRNLASELINNETWFFRNKEIFDFLSDNLKQWKDNEEQKKLNILSVPCSTGEESYSIVITLFENMFKPNEFAIDAIDMSSKVIENTQQALYSKESLKELNDDLIEKYFYQAEDLYIMNPKISNLVNFYEDNIADENFLHSNKKYDIIVAKNFLNDYCIDSHRIIFNNIYSLLDDEGILITTSEEATLFDKMFFNSYDNDNPFVLRKFVQSQEKQDSTNIENKSKSVFDKIKSALKPATSNLKIIDTADNIEEVNLGRELNNIKNLIDKNRFDSADEKCRQLLKSIKDNPDVFYYMGMINESLNKPEEAEEYYHKALYLEPYHYESLVHLILIFENKGWKDRAALLRKRIEKITGMQ
jgi:chemotaxis protein methyltransferase WspC